MLRKNNSMFPLTSYLVIFSVGIDGRPATRLKVPDALWRIMSPSDDVNIFVSLHGAITMVVLGAVAFDEDVALEVEFEVTFTTVGHMG